MCCRISGSVGYPQNVVGQATLYQKRGGPDNQAWHQLSIEPNIVFGHDRLAIIDLSENGNQPMFTERYAMVANAEIYNYKDIGTGNNDCRVLLNHINKIGFENALQSLNGMFSIAVYDRVLQKIYLAVDRFSQKSIYYFHDGDKFAFASSPAALYHIKDKWELDRNALQSYWLLGSVMGEDSLFKGIKKLTGSYMAEYDCFSSKLTVKRFWQPKFQEKTDEIEDLVLDSVRKVQVSDVPVHIFLSGGIDSTIVASQFESGKAVHLESPEEVYAQQAADRFGIEMNVIKVSEIKTEEYITDYIKECGEPSMAGIIPYTAAKEVSKFGKVAISANGADELFFGYDRTSEGMNLKQTYHIFRNIGAPLKYMDGHCSIPQSSGRLLELKSYVQFDLNKTLDFASMCHGLEVRCPFLDHRLVEMALSIPESVHRAQGNKTILKNILRKFGFDNKFLNRPKLGFSLHAQPANMDNLISIAWKWVQNEGFLNIEGKKLSPRDDRYLKMSALSFYYWHQTWKHKIA